MRWLVALVLLVGILAPAAAFAAPKESVLYIQVRESWLRAQPQFWAAPVGKLAYGDALVALGAAPTSKSWLRARLGDSEGYVHVSAVTSRKVVFKPTARTDSIKGASGDVVLAGKGFNKQVEDHYRSSKGLDFAAVDAVEQLKIDPAEEAKFISDGKLSAD